ncbi:MAG: ester cyclase [Candidatus Dormibacteria bacterium]
MSLDETRRVMEGYFGSHGGSWFADDVEFHDMSQPEPQRGRANVEAWLDSFYHGAFAEARADEARLVVGDGVAAADWVFKGRHAGSLMGEQPTGKLVEVPMAALYEIAAGEIVRARLYYDSAALARQLQPDGVVRAV